MKWKCKVDDRYVTFTLDDGRIAEMKKRGEKFGPRYTVISKLYENKAQLEVVEPGFSNLHDEAFSKGGIIAFLVMIKA